jgi:hypothetical protein
VFGQFHLEALGQASAKMFLYFRLGLLRYDSCRKVNEVRSVFKNSSVTLHSGLPFITEVILLVVVLERLTKPCDILRHGEKVCVLKLVDPMHAACKISGGLFNCLPFAGPMAPSLVE